MTVRGTGFSTAQPGIYVGLGAAGHRGFYQASSAGALVEGQTVAVATQYGEGSIAQGRTAHLRADGSFTLTLTLPAGATASDYAVYTSKAHGQGRSDTSQNVVVRLSAEKESEGTGSGSGSIGSSPSSSQPGSAPVTGGTGSSSHAPGQGSGQSAEKGTPPVYETVCTAASVSGAGLQWGIKSSFRNYISGGIAQGSWSTNSGAAYSGGAFTFGAGSGTYAKDSRTGTVSFPGSVHFTGHDGVLDLTLSNLRFRQDGPSSATLIADVRSSSTDGEKSNRAGVKFATISTSGLQVTAGQVTLKGAATTLTAAGAESFAGFYEAGTALDPVSLTIPLGESTDCRQVLVKDGTGAYATGAEPGSGSLAATGVEAGGLLGAGAGLLALGVAAVAAARRRQGQHVA